MLFGDWIGKDVSWLPRKVGNKILWLPGEVANQFGSVAAQYALPYVVLDATESEIAAGAAMAASGLARFLELHAGVAADRYDRKQIMLMAQAVGAAAAAAATALVLVDAPDLALGLTATTIVESIAATYYFRVFQTVVRDFLADNERNTGNRLTGSTGSAAGFAGQSLGPAMAGFAPAAPFGLNFLSYLGNFANILGLQFPTQVRAKPDNLFREIGEAVRAVWRNEFLRELTAISTINNAAWAMLGLRTATVLHEADLSDWARGAVVAAPAVGAILSGYLPEWFDKIDVTKLYPVALANMAALFTLQASTTNPVVIALAGFFDTMLMAATNNKVGTYQQNAFPGELQGRTGSVRGLFQGTSLPIGAFVAGVLASAYGGDAVAGLAANITVATAAGYGALTLARHSRDILTPLEYGLGMVALPWDTSQVLAVPAANASETAQPDTVDPDILRNCALHTARVNRALALINDDTPEPDANTPQWHSKKNYKPLEATLGAQLQPDKYDGDPYLTAIAETVRTKQDGIDRVVLAVDDGTNAHIITFVNIESQIPNVEDQVLVLDTLVDDPDNTDDHIPHVRNYHGDENGENKWQPKYNKIKKIFRADFTTDENGKSIPARRRLPWYRHTQHPHKLQGPPSNQPDHPEPTQLPTEPTTKVDTSRGGTTAPDSPMSFRPESGAGTSDVRDENGSGANSPAAESQGDQLSQAVVDRIRLLQQRAIELVRRTAQLAREGTAFRAAPLNQAQDQILAEIARLTTTGTISDDVPVVAGPDTRLALDWVFPDLLVKRVRTMTLGYIVSRRDTASAEARALHTELIRMVTRAAEVSAGTDHARDVAEVEALITISEWTDQLNNGGQQAPVLLDPADGAGDSEPHVPTPRPVERSSTAPNSATNPNNPRQEHDSNQRRHTVSHRAVLPEDTVRAVPEPAETADLGEISTLYAARMPDGRTVHFRLLGDPRGYPILLSPGTPVGIDGPLPDASELAKRGYTLIVVERPGYGDSTPLPGRTVADCARDIIHIATELFAFDHYSVLGRSGGGSVAIAVGALDPEHVDRVVSLVGTSPVLDGRDTWMANMAEANQAVYRSPDLQAMVSKLTDMAEQIARDGTWLIRYNQDAFTTLDHMWVGTHRDQLARGYQRGLRNYIHAWADDALQLVQPWGIRFDEYRADGVPVDIVHGSRDQFSPVSHSQTNAALIPTSTLYLFPGVTHMMGMDSLPVIAHYFRAERDSFWNQDPAGNGRRIAEIQRTESEPLPLPAWIHWSRGRWDSVASDYAPHNSIPETAADANLLRHVPPAEVQTAEIVGDEVVVPDVGSELTRVRQRGLCSPPPDRATLTEARQAFELELRQRSAEHEIDEEMLEERWSLLRQYAVIDWRIEKMAASLGRSSAEMREQMRRELKAALDGKPIGIRVREESLVAILDEGRIKGSRNPFGERADAEAEWFGSHVHENPPVYGFVAVDGVRPSQSGIIDALSELDYGDHQIYLKPEVKSRTTITVGDSIVEKDKTIPSPLDNPSEYSYGVDMHNPPIGRDYTGASFRSGVFIEAQIFDLTTSDIDFIALHQAPGAALRQALDRSGIKWRILTNRTIAAEGSPAERAAAIERTSQDVERLRGLMRSHPHLDGVAPLHAQLSADLRALNDSDAAVPDNAGGSSAQPRPEAPATPASDARPTSSRPDTVEPGQVRAPAGRTIIEGLGLPAEVATAEIIGEDPTAALLPEEQVLLDALETSPDGVRGREIVYGRTVAHRAQARLGLPVAPVLRAGGRATGMPVWQPGLVGSISHKQGLTLTSKTGYFVAAVSRHHRAVSIDAEYNEPIPNGRRDGMSLDAERAWLDRIGTDGGVHWDRVLFSAKEAVIKAWHPLTQRRIGFTDILITFDIERGEFTAQLLIADRSTVDGPPLTEFHGRFLVEGGMILTGIAVPHQDSGESEAAKVGTVTQPRPTGDSAPEAQPANGDESGSTTPEINDARTVTPTETDDAHPAQTEMDDRERQILGLAAPDLSNTATAGELEISGRAVQRVRSRLRSMFGIKDTDAARAQDPDVHISAEIEDAQSDTAVTGKSGFAPSPKWVAGQYRTTDEISHAFAKQYVLTRATCDSGTDLEAFQVFTQTLHDLREKHSAADVIAIGITSLSDGAMSRVVPQIAFSNLRTGALLLNADFVAGWRPDQVRDATTQLFAAAMVYAGRWRAEAHAMNALRVRFQPDGGEVDEEAFRAWLRLQFPDFCFTYNGNLVAREALVWSFRDVELGNPDVTAGEQTLYKLLVDRANELRGRAPRTSTSDEDSASARIKKMAQDLERDFDVKVVGADLADVDADIFEQFISRVRVVLTDHPGLLIADPEEGRPVIGIGPYANENAMAWTNWKRVNGDTRATGFMLSERFAINAPLFHDVLAGQVEQGFLVGDSARPGDSVMGHEGGHAVHFLSGLDDDPDDFDNIMAELVKLFVRTNRTTYLDPNRFVTWLEEELTGYSFGKDGKLNLREFYAEVYNAVTLHGKLATDAQKLAYSRIMTGLRPTTPPQQPQSPGDQPDNDVSVVNSDTNDDDDDPGGGTPRPRPNPEPLPGGPSNEASPQAAETVRERIGLPADADPMPSAADRNVDVERNLAFLARHHDHFPVEYTTAPGLVYIPDPGYPPTEVLTTGITPRGEGPLTTYRDIDQARRWSATGRVYAARPEAGFPRADPDRSVQLIGGITGSRILGYYHFGPEVPLTLPYGFTTPAQYTGD
ncbi:alpha/beta fold hydrolase, partial [Nocardia pseudovaccinii]|uniref:alpha/beta fold hydrolase n=1 Tax=Nocardia pseudovaccinii TaxID=189540 RepID=UPI0014725511